jgi:hypothetical protein
MMPKPIIAPTMKWVVDTGNAFQVANDTHRATASSADKGADKRYMWIGEHIGRDNPFLDGIGNVGSNKSGTDKIQYASDKNRLSEW